MATKIYIVGNDEDLRVRISLQIQSQFDMKLEGWARTASEAYDKIVRSKPDILIIDERLPDGNGFDLSRRLSGQLPLMKRIVMVSKVDAAVMAESLRAFVGAFVLKARADETLIRTIRGVQKEGFYWDPTCIEARAAIAD